MIPIAAIEELDGLKSSLFSARRASAVLDELGVSSKSVRVNGGKVWIDTESGKGVVLEFNSQKNDDRIIACAKALRDASEKTKKRVILVSNDRNVRIKARAYKISVEKYENDRHKISLNTALPRLILSQKELEEIGVYDQNLELQFGPKISFFIKDKGIKENEGFVLSLSREENIQLAIVYKGGRCIKTNSLNKWVYENGYVKPYVPAYYKDELAFNPNMEVLIQNLMDPKISLVATYGQAGTGKTRVAVGCALAMVNDDRYKYEKIIIIKAIVPVGKDIGYLHGDKNEKMSEWVLPIKTQINNILGGGKVQIGVDDYVNHSPYKDLVDAGILEV